MPMTESFYTVDGQMIGYESGGVRKDFLTDHLGSITAEIDQNQNRTFETRYSAYGRNNWSTGTGCGFGWVGSFGYRETGLFHMSHYVRARHYSYVTGSWSTVDPLWPGQSAFGYVLGRATNRIDRFGLAPVPVNGLVRKVKVGGCGGVEFMTTWTLPLSEKRAGAVIQLVTITASCKKCDGSPCDIWEKGNYRRQYLEAWIVDGNGKFNEANKNMDFFAFGGAGGCTTGSLNWQGLVAFFPEYVIGPPDWRRSGEDHPAGKLWIVEPVSLQFFKKLGGIPNQKHTLTMTWNCCVKRPEYAAVGCFLNLCQDDKQYGGQKDPACYNDCTQRLT